jgi:predicted transcriptional regulator
MERFDDFVKKEEQIAHSEITPKNRNEIQIRLATELFERLLGEKIDFTDRNQRNEALEYWSEKGYSKAYRELENSEQFKNHSRLQGNIFKITFEDVARFLERGDLPE